MSQSDSACFPALSYEAGADSQDSVLLTPPPPLSTGVFPHWKPHCTALPSNLEAELRAPCKFSMHSSLIFSPLLGCSHLIWMSSLFPPA